MIAPLLIVGTTSSGKTALALWLTQVLTQWNQNCTGVDILAVDSKQVFKEQDIVTGKDTPAETTAHIWGQNLRNPDQNWDITLFLREAEQAIDHCQKNNRQLIIVGGTPQYTLSLFSPPQSAFIEPNQELRKRLETYTVEQLQLEVSAKKLASMNVSDRQNPRRLIRAIEVESADHQSKPISPLLELSACHWIGMSVSRDELERRIRTRVVQRLSDGAIEEYQSLHTKYPGWSAEAKAAIGYHEIEEFLAGKISQETLIEVWTLHELQYAKRQMQWWKRETEIHWFDSQDPQLKMNVLQELKDCYNQ